MIYLVLACLLYTAAVLIGTTASRNANTNIVSAITNAVSVVVPILVAAPALSKKSINGHKYGLWMAALGGVVIGLFVLALNKSFSENKVGIVTPIVYGGTILLSTVLSYFIFKEKITMLEGFGLVFVLVGLALVAYARTTAS
jgi:drug/metabolite transporter (DMT)-like permease